MEMTREGEVGVMEIKMCVRNMGLRKDLNCVEDTAAGVSKKILGCLEHKASEVVQRRSLLSRNGLLPPPPSRRLRKNKTIFLQPQYSFVIYVVDPPGQTQDRIILPGYSTLIIKKHIIHRKPSRYYISSLDR